MVGSQPGCRTRGFSMVREELTRLTGNGNGECSQNDCPNLI